MSSTRTNHDGYTLLELLLTTTLLVVMVSLCLNLYITYNRVRTNAATEIDRDRQVQSIEVAFRNHVQESARTRDAFLSFAAGDRLLILESGAGDRVIVLGDTHTPGAFTLSRWRQIDEAWESDYLKEFTLDGGSFEFIAADSGPIELKIYLDSRKDQEAPPSQNTLLATLREGDGS